MRDGSAQISVRDGSTQCEGRVCSDQCEGRVCSDQCEGRVCSDQCVSCHTETEAAHQTFYRAQSQYTDTGPTSSR